MTRTTAVPLTFLTADRDTVAAGSNGEEPFPHDDERARRRRPYRLGPWRVAGAAVLLLLSSYVLISALIVAMTGKGGGALALAGLGAVVTGGALRLLRMGVWVNRDGLRQVGLCYTVTLPWSQVAAVRTTQQPVKWLGLPRTVQGQALEVVRTNGGAPLRYLLTTHNADFLNRPEAFDQAADVIEGWAAESRGRQAPPSAY